MKLYFIAFSLILLSGVTCGFAWGDNQMNRLAAGNIETAPEVYRHRLSVDGVNNNKHYLLGLEYERNGNLKDAEEQFRYVVGQDSKNGDARRHLADIYTLRGNFPRAISEYRQLLTDYSDNPLLHFKLARAFERNKKYQDSISEYQEVIKLAPNNIEAHKELAALYLKRRKWEKAANQYQSVLGQNSNDAATRNALISIYIKQGKHKELFALVKKEVELFPNDPDSHFRLGLMYDFRKEYDASINEYQKALDLKSDHAKALKGMGKVYLKTGKFKKARVYLEAAKNADPNLRGTHELLDNLRIEQTRASAVKKRAYKAHKKRNKHQSVKKKRKSKKSHSVKKNKSKRTKNMHSVKKKKRLKNLPGKNNENKSTAMSVTGL
ncbi:MAG: tetratricopeptide repeat protein [Desulfuromonadaceae bacterium]|nr:tetratricopeptide repeat protein [Desulfuromonadaceae bacterium]